MPAKAVLLLDFDNVFSALWRRDRTAARSFGSDPGPWLAGLASADRRWLVLRCYLNPAGWTDCDQEPSGRLYYSRFRPALVRAGFEVVDCPSLTQGGCNAADIRLVLDAMDLLRAECRYEEFVIASGDSDFAPLLRRIRAEDRRTTIIAQANAAAAYVALADEVLGHDVLRLEPARSVHTADDPFRCFVAARYAAAVAPLKLGALAQDVINAVPSARPGRWSGAGTFSRALVRLDLPGACIDACHLWDRGRHEPPPRVAKAA